MGKVMSEVTAETCDKLRLAAVASVRLLRKTCTVAKVRGHWIKQHCCAACTQLGAVFLMRGNSDEACLKTSQVVQLKLREPSSQSLVSGGRSKALSAATA